MSSKSSFIGADHPFNTCMIQSRTTDRAIDTIKKSILDGCDAIGFQMCQLNKKERTGENIRSIFSCARNRPTYVTNYRYGLNVGAGDDELAEGLLFLADNGATLVDVMGDMFDKDPRELTMSSAAIERQKRLIGMLHDKGSEVLMSSHLFRFAPAEEVLEIAHEQRKRGADIVKIVTAGNDDVQQTENIRITALMKKEMDCPFLFLSVGSHNYLHRLIGPLLGCCMWLTVHEHDELSTKSQLLCSKIREFKNMQVE